MPVDMKERIAEAAKTLLMDKHKKKLTVKDIVEECQITRQTFYYHFEDIPGLLRWVMERAIQKMLEDVQEQEEPEQRLRYFFLMAINVAPYIKKGLQSNYHDELERLMSEYIYRLFAQAMEREALYRDCTQTEVRLLLRYHSQAVLSLLRDWTDRDTEELDEIVRMVYRIITGELPSGGRR